jgi:hypothetical protein
MKLCLIFTKWRFNFLKRHFSVTKRRFRKLKRRFSKTMIYSGKIYAQSDCL